MTRTARGASGKSRRNRRRRQELMAKGLTKEQAQAVIDADGRAAMELQIAKDRREAEEMSRRAREENKRYRVQSDNPHSVQALPTNFEGNRRRH